MRRLPITKDRKMPDKTTTWRIEFVSDTEIFRHSLDNKDMAFEQAEAVANELNKPVSIFEDITSGKGLGYQTIAVSRTLVEPVKESGESYL